MATVRIITAMTIDGFLPEADSPLMQWLKTDGKGFPYWHEHSTYPVHSDYPVLDLVCDKNSTDKSCIYNVEISDPESIGFLSRLSHFNIIDQLIIHILPEIAGAGDYLFSDCIPTGLILRKSVRLKNGICRNIYCRDVQ